MVIIKIKLYSSFLLLSVLWFNSPVSCGLQNLQIRGRRSKQGAHVNLHLTDYEDANAQAKSAYPFSAKPKINSYDDSSDGGPSLTQGQGQDYYQQPASGDYDYDDQPSQGESSISLDAILKSAKGQQIIMEEAHRQLLERIPKNGVQVAEEIVEQIEKDAQVEMKEDELNAGAFSCRPDQPLSFSLPSASFTFTLCVLNARWN